MSAYLRLEAEGGNVRVRVRDIKGFRPLYSLLQIGGEPIGTTIILKDGREIDVAATEIEIMQTIKGRNWRR
jgi:hypothetical protein